MAGIVRIDDMFGKVDASTFLGLPQCADIEQLDARVAILGAPLITPYRSIGAYCVNAPRAIRSAIAPYAANLHHVDFDLGRPLFPEGTITAADCGDLPYDEEDFAANRERLGAAVARMLDRDAVPVLIGGDDSVPIPLLQAFAGRGEYTVVQIDAHIDWRDEVDGERHGLSSNMRRASEMAHITRIVQVGQRGIGSARPSDHRDAVAWGVQFFPGRDVAARGVAAAIEAVPAGADVIIALDVDGLDPSLVPGVIGRAPGGLGYWQTVELIHGIARRGRLRGFSLVEYMPERDVDEQGALVCARLIANVIGLAAACPLPGPKELPPSRNVGEGGGGG